MWGRSSYMSADIQERWMQHKAPLLEGRTRGRSSCPPGQAAIRLPPSCQGLEKWPIHTQDIGSVFKDRQDMGAHNTHTGRCVFLTTCNTHAGERLGEKVRTRLKITYKHALCMFNNSEQIPKTIKSSMCLWTSSVSLSLEKQITVGRVFTQGGLPSIPTTHSCWNCETDTSGDLIMYFF